MTFKEFRAFMHNCNLATEQSMLQTIFNSNAQFVILPLGEKIYAYNKIEKRAFAIIPILTTMIDDECVLIYKDNHDAHFMIKLTTNKLRFSDGKGIYRFFTTKEKLADYITKPSSAFQEESLPYCEKYYNIKTYSKGFISKGYAVMNNEKHEFGIRGYKFDDIHNSTQESPIPFFLWYDKDGLHDYLTIKENEVFLNREDARMHQLETIVIEDF